MNIDSIITLKKNIMDKINIFLKKFILIPKKKR